LSVALGRGIRVSPLCEMRLDVIIPCAGSAKFIDETLASVLAQTRKPDAIYLVDNASRHTGYREIADKCNSSLVHYIRFEERLTATLNWQRCLRVGANELCLLLHDDDTLLPDAVETGIGLLEDRPEATCALLPRVLVEKEMKDLEADLRREIEKFRRIDALPEPARSFFIATANINHMSALFFRRGPLGFYPQLRWMPDQGYLFAHVAQGGDIVLARQSGALIRRHDQSGTATLFKENGRGMVEERLQLRTAIDFFTEERGLTAADFPSIAAIAELGSAYYLKRLLQACFSWPLRKRRLHLGREIERNPAMRAYLGPALRVGRFWPAAACLITGMASDFRYFLREKDLRDT